MLSRFPLVAVLVVAISMAAVAAPRYGAPRPLQSNGELVVGTHATWNENSLAFMRLQDETPLWWQVTQRPQSTPVGTAGSTLNDWKLARLHVIPHAVVGLYEAQWKLSPGGARAAFVSSRSGLQAVYVAEESNLANAATARRVVTMARHPSWLNRETLIYESIRPGRKGLFRVTIPRDASTRPSPQLLFVRGGESAVSPDGRTICVAAPGDRGGDTRLYLLASDGSGARTIPETEGARRPSFSADGKAIFFDAPAPGEAAAQRVLWTLPLSDTPPTAHLFAVREGKNGEAEIIGTLFSGEAGAMDARLELAPNAEEGGNVKAKPVRLERTPVHNNVLGVVSLPRQAEGESQSWTLRLTAASAAGEQTESTLSFEWPLQERLAGSSIILPPLFPSRLAELEMLIAESQEEEAEAAPDSPTNVRATAAVPPTPAVRQLPFPAPDIAPAAAPPAPRVARTETDLPVPALPPAPGARPAPAQKPVAPAPRQTAPAPKPAPPAVKAPPVRVAQQVKQEPQKPSDDSGIPSQMKAKSKVPVTVSLRNTGSRSWSSTGDEPVRLVYRWVNKRTNTRHRWAVHWLREVVQPGESTRLKFDLVAPPAPADYILTYALVRLNSEIYDGKNYKPPSPRSEHHRWPGEFGAVSFEVVVTP